MIEAHLLFAEHLETRVWRSYTQDYFVHLTRSQRQTIDEDVDVIAMSLLNGAHTVLFPKVARYLRQKGIDDILLVGGGIIPDADKKLLEKEGITGNFGPGTPLNDIIQHILRQTKGCWPGHCIGLNINCRIMLH